MIQRATVMIDDLRLRAIVGINDWEREKPQDIVVNIRFDFDAGPAVASDQIEHTVDYKALKRRVIQRVEQSAFLLLERLTSAVLDEVLADERVLTATVRIDKPHALRFAKSVALQMTRDRKEGDGG